MPDRIQVAVLTHAGGAHIDEYFRSLAAIDEVASVVLSDIDGPWEKSARELLGPKLGRVYRSHDELLRAEKPPLALVTYEAALAPPVIAAAIEAGCHVYAEKPSCVEADDFAKLVRRADAKHLLLMLALANRSRPDIAEARRMIAAGTFGKLYGLEFHIIADQTRLRSPAYHKDWRAQKARAGGGHLIWLGIHWLDLATFLTGLPIEEVAAFTSNVGGQPIDVEDSATVTMRFAGGMLGSFTSGYYLDKGYHSHIKLWGEKGWLEMNPRGTPSLWWQVFGDAKNPDVQVFQGPTYSSAYLDFTRAAVRAAADLEDPPISNAESLRALETVFACYKAAETGKRQTVSG